jgi:hypothetical protein
MLVSGYSGAQLYDGYFGVDLVTTKAISDKDFIDGTNVGVKLGYVRFINEHLAGGVEGSYTTFNQYVPRKTYYYDGGAITTDLFNYHYYFTIGAKGMYIFSPGKRLMPYSSLGLGVAFSEYKVFYNVYQEQDSKTAVYLRPESGVMYRFTEYGSLGVKAGLSFDYAFTESEYFEVKNFSGVSFQIGILLLN